MRSAYILAFADGYWTWVGNMNFDRSGHVCGMTAADPEGKEEDTLVITAGGKGVLEVELFSLREGVWRMGPMLPHKLDRAKGYQMGRDLLIIGGFHLGVCPVHFTECFSSKYIYEFTMTEWKRRNHTMALSRGQHSVIGIPKTITKHVCSKLCFKCPGTGTYFNYY